MLNLNIKHKFHICKLKLQYKQSAEAYNTCTMMIQSSLVWLPMYLWDKLLPIFLHLKKMLFLVPLVPVCFRASTKRLPNYSKIHMYPTCTCYPHICTFMYNSLTAIGNVTKEASIFDYVHIGKSSCIGTGTSFLLTLNISTARFCKFLWCMQCVLSRFNNCWKVRFGFLCNIRKALSCNLFILEFSCLE